MIGSPPVRVIYLRLPLLSHEGPNVAPMGSQHVGDHMVGNVVGVGSAVMFTQVVLPLEVPTTKFAIQI